MFEILGAAVLSGFIIRARRKNKEIEQQNEIEEQKENARKAIECRFDTSLTYEQFVDIVRRETKSISRLSVEISGAEVVGRVQSISGISSWIFTVDFNDWGAVTGEYWVMSSNCDSDIPWNVAHRISAEIRKVAGSSVQPVKRAPIVRPPLPYGVVKYDDCIISGESLPAYNYYGRKCRDEYGCDCIKFSSIGPRENAWAKSFGVVSLVLVLFSLLFFMSGGWDVVIGFLLFVLSVVLSIGVVAVRNANTVVNQDGFTVSILGMSRQFGWPPSNACFRTAVSTDEEKSLSAGVVDIEGENGRYHRLYGLVAICGSEDESHNRVKQQCDYIWEWGVQHGYV